jgi:hypothetical protein
LTAQQFAFNRRSSDHHPLRFALDDARERQHEKYKQIRASIRAVGIIEPLVVFPLGKGGYRVLDGRKRLDVVKEGNLATEIDCWLANRGWTSSVRDRRAFRETETQYQRRGSGTGG